MNVSGIDVENWILGIDDENKVQVDEFLSIDECPCSDHLSLTTQKLKFKKKSQKLTAFSPLHR